MIAGIAIAIRRGAGDGAALNVFATMPEWGALTAELGGDKVTIYTATNALQDAASRRGEAEPDRPRTQRGSGRRHRRRARDRLAAAGHAAGGQSEDPARQARVLRGGELCRASRKAGAPRPLRGRCPPGRQSAHPDRSAQHRSRRRTARGAPGGARPGQRRLLPGALQSVRRALERGDRDLGKAGGAVTRDADTRPAQGVHLSRGLARAQ